MQQLEFNFTIKEPDPAPSPANVEPPDGVARFTVGHTYTDEWSYDGEDYSLSYTILSRTSCTVTAEDKNGEIKRFTLCKDAEAFKSESFMPWGRYSMAPVIDARRGDMGILEK